MDIGKMGAGQELDALVAEKIFEMVPCDEWELHDVQSFRMDLPNQCGHEQCYPRGKPACYSTNMAAAWQVVEKMQTLDAYTELIAYEQHGYSCLVEKEIPQGAGSIEWGGEAWDVETAPLAICRAALKAMEELWKTTSSVNLLVT